MGVLLLASALGLLGACDAGGSGYLIGEAGPRPVLEAELAIAGARAPVGHSVSISGDRALVGAPLAQGRGGEAVVFVRTSEGWVREASLTVDGEGHSFGSLVSLSGNRAVVSTGHYGGGFVYGFARTPEGWVYDGELVAGEGIDHLSYGTAVAISGDRAVVGASRRFAGAPLTGAADVFVRSDAGWVRETTLVPDDLRSFTEFGWSVALSGDRALIGAPSAEGGGAAYVFHRTEAGWVQEAKIPPPAPARFESFGRGGSLSGDRALIVAHSSSGPAAVYVFGRTASGWAQEAEWVADGSLAAWTSASLSGDLAVLGGRTHGGRQSAHLFAHVRGGWTELPAFPDIDSTATASLSVDVDAGRVIVGAPSEAGKGAYVFAIR